MLINQSISAFVDVAIQEKLLSPEDKICTINRLLAIFHLSDFETSEQNHTSKKLLDLLDNLVLFAQNRKIISNTKSNIEIFESQIMDLVTLLPSVVSKHFWMDYDENPVKATDNFYELSQKNDYIKTRNIAKNIQFEGKSKYGNLQITINLSKPEKDPNEIAKAQSMPLVNYPKCALCFESEGYRGHENHAARQSHRIIRLKLKNNTYGFLYSPYIYYNEHSIFESQQHRPMSVIRLVGKSEQEMLDLAEAMLSFWREYSDEDLGIYAKTDRPHNTITPIVRRADDNVIMNLVLQNNRADEMHSLGIFHPHEDVQHIKKENIGLIEVMGLAILPGRVVEELTKVENFLLDKTDIMAVPDIHREWANTLKESACFDERTVDTFLQQAIVDKFARVLEDAGVYKRLKDN